MSNATDMYNVSHMAKTFPDSPPHTTLTAYLKTETYFNNFSQLEMSPDEETN